MWIGVGAEFLFYYVLHIKSLFFNHLSTYISEESKLIIVTGRTPDPERVIEHSVGKRAEIGDPFGQAISAAQDLLKYDECQYR